jgi:hypothetical protein
MKKLMIAGACAVAVLAGTQAQAETPSGYVTPKYECLLAKGCVSDTKLGVGARVAPVEENAPTGFLLRRDTGWRGKSKTLTCLKIAARAQRRQRK